jgi:hypothetical protein
MLFLTGAGVCSSWGGGDVPDEAEVAAAQLRGYVRGIRQAAEDLGYAQRPDPAQDGSTSAVVATIIGTERVDPKVCPSMAPPSLPGTVYRVGRAEDPHRLHPVPALVSAARAAAGAV